MDRQMPDWLTFKAYFTSIARDQPNQHIKAGCLSRAVWPEQAYDFAGCDF
jgi:hypothetical protein